MSLQWDRSVISFFSSLVPTTLGYLFKLRELVRKSGCIRSTYPLYGPRYRFDLYIVIHDVVIYFFSHPLSFPLSSEDMVCVSTGRDQK